MPACGIGSRPKDQSMKQLIEFTSILGLTAMLGLFVGCGNAETGDDTPPPADEEEEVTEAPEGTGSTEGEGE